MQIDPFLSPCTKLKSKWIKGLHFKSDTFKLIEEKEGKNLEHIGTAACTPFFVISKGEVYYRDLLRGPLGRQVSWAGDRGVDPKI